MEQRRLDSATTTLVLGIAQDRAAVVYLGPRLAETQPLAELALLGEAATPHGELDVPLYDALFPGFEGLPGTSPAFLLSRDGQRQMVAPEARFATAPGYFAAPGYIAAPNHAAAPGTATQSDAEPEATYNPGACESIGVLLRDADVGLELYIHIEATQSGVFRWQTTLRNTGNSALAVDWLASLCIPLAFPTDEWLRLHGFWANEFQGRREALGISTLSFENQRGRTGHQSWPGIVVGSRGFAHQQGEVLCVALEWSGNHRVEATPTGTGARQLQAGVPLQTGELTLAAGEHHNAPAALLAYSAEGMNGLRTQSRRYWQQRKGNALPHRPVHFNSWEGCYFDHDAKRISALMGKAAALGAERFVLDDGWMAGRTGAGLGLGDWRCCPTRYPQGLAPVARKARELGMEFGLWVEPEMVTPDADIAKAHPEWLIEIPHRDRIAGREQYLLNLTLPAVREHILECLERLIEETEPAYLKWDMNRDLAQVGPESCSSYLGMTHGFYALLESIRSRHPGICLEACASGGGRSDAGSFARADRLWPSDSMDPIQRFRVMSNASVFLPTQAMGWHVGSQRSETSGVSSPLSTRCILAQLGHLGLELDPATLSDDDTQVVKHWISFYKESRDWLASADSYFLDELSEGTEAVLLTDEDAQRALLVAVQGDYPSSALSPLTRLPEPLRDRRYRVHLLNPDDSRFVQRSPAWQSGEEIQVSGNALCQKGLRLPTLRFGECALISLEAID